MCKGSYRINASSSAKKSSELPPLAKGAQVVPTMTHSAGWDELLVAPWRSNTQPA